MDLGRKAKLLPFLWTSLQQWELMPVIRELSEYDSLGSCFCQWLRRMIVHIFLPFKYLFFSHPGIRGWGVLKSSSVTSLGHCRHRISGEESPTRPAVEQCGVTQARAPALH